MRLIALALLFLPLSARAQYQYTGEVFAGYSFLNLKPGEELATTGLNGWHVALSGYATEWFGFAADFSGHYGTTDAPPPFADTTGLDVEQWSYLFGPEIRVLRKERFAASFHTLFGRSRSRNLRG